MTELNHAYILICEYDDKTTQIYRVTANKFEGITKLLMNHPFKYIVKSVIYKHTKDGLYEVAFKKEKGVTSIINNHKGGK